ncbi:hypothetical protein [Myxococcus sp. AS-1-15]|uniref:hypothetical protein n=1 Tax=Myxococcus sp. AS-1-15 TaxID=2874600 RepID=UPI001CC0E4F8|nr:hypothetical protein [Myxococcus sp. AS-1-15]MBZ4402005.1 hypothetical protein [Myxococcus sp. AS-1-15]
MKARPYHFGPRLRAGLARLVNRLHLTRNRVSGYPAVLVREPTEGACQVLVTAYPDCAVAEHRAGRPDLVPGVLDVVAAAFEAALDDKLGRAHLESGRRTVARPVVSVTVLPAPRAASPRWIPHAVAAAALTALVWPRAVDHIAPGIGGSARVEYVVPDASSGESYLTDLVEFGRPLQMGGKKICAAVPKQPLPGQDVPPCRSPARPLRGGCWVEITDKPSPCCPENTAEHNGSCYMGLKGGVQMKLPDSILLKRAP